MTVPLQCKHKATRASRASAGEQSPCTLEPQVVPGSALGASAPLGVPVEGQLCAGPQSRQGDLPQPLHNPASMAGDFPGWADMLSPVSNCSLVPVPEWELAPSPPLHCLFPQPSSHGAHGFSSPARSPALSHWLCLAPHIAASSALPPPSYSFRFSLF